MTGQLGWLQCPPTLVPPFWLPWYAAATAHQQIVGTLQLLHPGVPVKRLEISTPGKQQTILSPQARVHPVTHQTNY